jgi:hypothetical protein
MKVPLNRRWLQPVIAALAVISGLSATASAANIALNKPAFASVANSTAGNITDGSLSTEWNTGGDPAAPNHFVGVDLGAQVHFLYGRVYWNANQPRGFAIEVATTVDLADPTSFSYGSGDWTPVYTRTPLDPQPASPDLLTLSLPEGNTGFRYVRISGTDGASDTVLDWGVRELQVLDTPLATVSGVTKAAGGPIPNLLVQLTGPSSAPATQTVRSDSNGAFSFPGLDAGDYTLTGYAPGQYAPASVTFTAGSTNITQDLVFSTAVHNVTAPLPVYEGDFIASTANPKDQNAQTRGQALPLDELPPGGQVWSTATALPTTGVIGPDLPATLNFAFPPTAAGAKDGKITILDVAALLRQGR